MKWIVLAGVLAGGVARSFGQWAVAEAPGSPLDMKTGLIMNSAWNIESGVESLVMQMAHVEAHTRAMRTVQEARQRVIVALAQMRLLQEHGLVLLRMGPAAEIVGQTEAFWAQPDAEPQPVLLAEMPALTSPVSIVNDFKGLLEDSRNLYTQGKSLWNAVKGLNAGFSLNPSGLLQLADAGWTLFDETQKTANAAVGVYYKVENLIWTGRRFIGADWGHIDHIVGFLGATIDLDREIPAAILPISARLASALESARTGSPVASQNNGALAGRGNSLFVAGSNAAQREEAYRIAESMYLRPESPLDSAWVHMVARGGGASAMQFYAAVSGAGGITYDPAIGYFRDGERRNRFNLNNGLSGGAHKAVARFYRENRRAGANPFDRFARTLAPILGDLLRGLEIGQPVRITEADVHRAGSMRPPALSGFPRLAEWMPLLDMRGWAVEKRWRLWRRVGNGVENVLVVKPTLRQQEEYAARIRASDTAIRRNRRQAYMAIAMLNYCQAAMEAASHLRAALQGIAGTLTAINAVESIPVMIQNSDHFIAYLQQMIAWYGGESGRLQQEQHDLLSGRARHVQAARDELQRSASLRVSAFISRSGSGHRRRLPFIR